MGDLAYHVRHFMPNVDERSIVYREALLVARDYAALRKAVATSEFGYACACEAHSTAGALVYADLSVDRLKVAVAYCRNLVHASYLAEHLSDEGAGQ